MRVRWGVALFVAAVVGVLGLPPPAEADPECVQLDVWLTWSGSPDQYLTPWAPGWCVVPTPGMQELSHPEASHEFDELPPDPNVPSGAGLEGSVPFVV